MGTISLENLEFFAYHGFFDEEQAMGNKYSVDIMVWVDFSEAATTDKLSKTVNYGDLYKIIATEMEKKTRLLEHLAGRMIEKTLTQFPQIQAVEVSVSKYNPPVGGVCERSRVRMKQINDKL